MQLTTEGYYHLSDGNIIDIGYKCISNTPMVEYFDSERDMCFYVNEEDNSKTLLPLVEYLQLNYIDFINPNLKPLTYNTYNGVDPDTEVWHRDHYEGNHISFLCYFDNMSDEIGGSISFRYPEKKIYPKVGDIIIMSHYTDHEHIVELSNAERKVIHIGFA